MNILSNKQRLFLKKMSHHLKPVVMIGQAGLNDNIIHEIDMTLEKHELIKIKITGSDKSERAAIATTISQRSNATLIHKIGQMNILYRPSQSNPKVALP